MKVRTRNSLYLIEGKGEIFEATKLENDGLKGNVKVGDVFRGNSLTVIIGRSMVLTGLGSALETSSVVSVE